MVIGKGQAVGIILDKLAKHGYTVRDLHEERIRLKNLSNTGLECRLVNHGINATVK